MGSCPRQLLRPLDEAINEFRIEPIILLSDPNNVDAIILGRSLAKVGVFTGTNFKKSTPTPAISRWA